MYAVQSLVLNLFMPQIETVLTPALFHLHKKDLQSKQVVVIDILRATTTMIVAMENGAAEIKTVDNIENTLQLRNQGYLVAGERNGEKVEGFDFGNSPQEFTRSIIEGQKIALTTTNGTKAIAACEGAKHRYVSSFRNITAMVNVLIANNCDTLLFCAGWKDKFNLEDTVFAGALSHQLLENGFSTSDDATLMAQRLWLQGKSDLTSFLADASHVQRFKSLHIESDLEACLKFDTYHGVLSL